jgi:GNAT superfamily N-acetyltransferase
VVQPLEEVLVRPLRDDERATAGAVAGRALSTSPTSYWTWGDDALVRLRRSLDVFVGFVQGQTAPLGALIGEHVVGVCGAAPPGECIAATSGEAGRVVPETIEGHGSQSRIQYIWSIYCTRDLPERHWHLGPVSVEPALQGLGIGALMLRAFGEQMDAAGEVGWLETDKPENVVFYRRAGWEVADELTEHGLTSWWMRRDPR